jgi:hypothetical protein
MAAIVPGPRVTPTRSDNPLALAIARLEARGWHPAQG